MSFPFSTEVFNLRHTTLLLFLFQMDNGRPVQLPVSPDIQTQAPPGQPVQLGQRVYDQSTPGHQEQSQARRGFDLAIDTDFLKSPLYNIKIAEFVSTTFL